VVVALGANSEAAENKNGAKPKGFAPPNFYLYFQNIKSKGANRQGFKKYLRREMSNLP
jgi:hypothetical protein